MLVHMQKDMEVDMLVGAASEALWVHLGLVVAVVVVACLEQKITLKLSYLYRAERLTIG